MSRSASRSGFICTDQPPCSFYLDQEAFLLGRETLASLQDEAIILTSICWFRDRASARTNLTPKYD